MSKVARSLSMLARVRAGEGGAVVTGERENRRISLGLSRVALCVCVGHMWMWYSCIEEEWSKGRAGGGKDRGSLRYE